MAEVSSGGVTMAQVAAVMPQPAVAAPPPVALNSTPGSVTRFALEDHTHQSRLQATRALFTPDANGRFVWSFGLPYDSGVVPVVEVTAETPTGVTYRNDATILQGGTTNTQTTIIVTRLNQNVVVGLLNAVLPVFAPVTGPVWVNVMSRAPS